MRIRRETDYAVRCVLYLAGRPEGKAAIAEIAGEMEIPPSFLPKIVQKLVKAGLLSSAQGVGGGVRLLKKPGEISLFDIVDRMEEGGAGMNDCVIENRGCHRSPFCAVHPAWVEIREMMERKLKSYTFDRFLKG